MSYLVLARKYRPRNFSEMVGQEHVVQALGNALTQQRLHHAYMFTGTRGVGKTTVSRVLAKSLNCTGADGSGDITATPCGVCPACTQIDAGRFVDYTELDAASNRGVEEVQQLLEQAVYKPVQGRFKVFMIDEVHMLSSTAFNAMLKTLEEPPEYLKFVLATTDPQKVPVTVLSRCLQFNLRPMAPETVVDHLQRVLAAEQVLADIGALRLLARAARGSMRDALSLTDQAIAFGSGQLSEASVRQMLGSVEGALVLQLIDALAMGNGRAVVDGANRVRAAGLSAATTLEDMARVLQRMAVHQAVPDMAVDPTDPDAAEIARLAASMPPDETQLLYSLCVHGRAELGLAPDEYAGLTMVLLRLLPFKPPARAAEKKNLTLAEPTPERPAPAPPPRAALPAGLTSPAPAAPEPAAPAPAAPEPASGQVSGSSPVVSPPAGPVISPPAPPPTLAERPAQAPGPLPTPPAHEAAWLGEPPPWGEAPPDDWGEASWSEAEAPIQPVRAAHPPLQPLAVRQLPQPVDDGSDGHPVGVESQDHASEIIAIRVLESDPDEAAEAPATITTAQRAPASELVPTPEGDFWHGVVQDLMARQAIQALVRELALQAQLVQRGEREWTLRVENETLAQSSAGERLQAALRDAGHAVRLKVGVGPTQDTPARRNTIAARRRLDAAEALLLDDPFVQEMMRDFGAKIVPGSIKPL